MNKTEKETKIKYTFKEGIYIIGGVGVRGVEGLWGVVGVGVGVWGWVYMWG